MEIDLNKLSTKEVFELINALNKRFIAVSGWGFIKDSIITDFDESSYFIESGYSVDHDLIEEFFKEFDYEVEDGFYEFKFLLSYSPAQVGCYPPPNIECHAYYDYVDSIIELKATVEEYKTVIEIDNNHLKELPF
ncbi:hypothetical protein [Epilithonimonas xixisoli]|nr:hypothetical protein [Epilithonimonas xixisoli]